MSTGRLQDFATSVIARGQITFGDVRRLQRDYLPGGITTREEAEILIALSDRLVRADRAWAQWLVAALACPFRVRIGQCMAQVAALCIGMALDQKNSLAHGRSPAVRQPDNAAAGARPA